jgi:2-amino-4-hydroxy-6-hydroxymethyldihydropteridine diphosphokinase
MPRIVYLGVGGNINPEENILKAARLLAARVSPLGCSWFYRSKAVGNPAQPDFINGVFKIGTDIPPLGLKFDVLRVIEESLGRVRTPDKNAPRPLDFDILLYGDMVMDDPRLTLPDPHITRYPFVFIPLLELAPELVLPPTGKKLKDLVNPDIYCHKLVKMVEFSLALKERCGT